MTTSTFTRIQRDTALWQLQTWVSFGLAIGLSAIGLLYLPGETIEKSFMVMGYVFCLSTAFGLSKFIRDTQMPDSPQKDTPMWKLVVWAGFCFSMGLTGWGLLNLAINPTYKAYLGVSWLFMMSTGFTLAKMLRDRHEADLQDALRTSRRGISSSGKFDRENASASASTDELKQ